MSLDKRSLFHEVPPHINGGESLHITTEFILRDDFQPLVNNKITRSEPYYLLNQTITLESYGNSASLNLYSNVLTPQFLRKLADDIEQRDEELTQELLCQKF